MPFANPGCKMRRLKTFLLFVTLLSPLVVRAWVPSGSANILAKPECHDEVLSKQIFTYLSHRSSGEKWQKQEWGTIEKMIQSFMDRCAGELYKGSFSPLVDYIKMESIEYAYKQHRDIREVSFQFPGDGYITRGILALKKSKTPRPLIIFKCGLSCDMGDTAMLYTLMVFFDMGPFNVLMLPSNTGTSFVKENHVFAVGGVAEGLQVTKIAQYITSGHWKYSDRVSRIHLFGMSLGGHAALYASLYADYIQGDTNLFSSVFVGCPVVDFKSSLDQVTSDTWFYKLLRRTVFGNITDLMRMVPWFDRYYHDDPRFNPNQGKLREMLLGGAFDYYNTRTAKASWANAPLANVRFGKEDNFWKWMDYSSQPLPLMKTPVYVWAPENDDVVLFKSNSRKLFESDARLNERHIYKLSTPRGGHCAFPSVYGWATAATVMNSFFIARSPELLKEVQQRKIVLNPKFVNRIRISGNQIRTRLTWEAAVDKDYITLTNDYAVPTCNANPKVSQPCVGRTQVRIRFDELKISKDMIPETKAEAQGLTRTLNSRIRFIDASGKPIPRSGTPAAILFTDYGKLDDLN
ncbi:MAG: alpha/beta hydrolase [Bdellovibrionota bacterium]